MKYTRLCQNTNSTNTTQPVPTPLHGHNLHSEYSDMYASSRSSGLQSRLLMNFRNSAYQYRNSSLWCHFVLCTFQIFFMFKPATYNRPPLQSVLIVAYSAFPLALWGHIQSDCRLPGWYTCPITGWSQQQSVTMTGQVMELRINVLVAMDGVACDKRLISLPPSVSWT